MPEISTPYIGTAGQNTPGNVYNTGPYGSPEIIAAGGTQTNLLRQEIDQIITLAYNLGWTDLAWIFAREAQAGSVNPVRFETGSPVTPLTITTSAGAGAPGASVTYTSTDPALTYFGLNSLVMFSNGQHGLITATPTATTFTVKPINATESLPAVTAGNANALLADAGLLTADGNSDMLQQFTPQIAQYDYVVQKIGPYIDRMDPWQMAQYKDYGTTNYIETRKKQLMNKLFAIFQRTVWLSRRGRLTLANGQSAWTTSGVEEQMTSLGGVPDQVCTPNTFVDVLRDTQATIATASSGNQYELYCSPRVADYIGAGVKGEPVRMTMQESSFNLTVTKFDFVSSSVTVIPTPSFDDVGANGTRLRNKAFLMPARALKLHHVNGFPMIGAYKKIINRMDNPAAPLDAIVNMVEANVAPILDMPAFTGLFTITV